MKEELKRLRKDLKEFSVKITDVKRIRDTDKDVWERARAMSRLEVLKRQFRQRHVLHSLIMGNSYKAIESKNREGNEMRMMFVISIAEHYGLSMDLISEDKRVGLM